MNTSFYIPATDFLKSRIQAIWDLSGDLSFNQELIVPKGVVEIIFDLSENDPAQAMVNDHFYHTTRCFINGYNTGNIQMPIKKNHHFFGVHFMPAAIRKYFKVPAGEFANSLIDLSLIDQSFSALWCQIKTSTSFDARVKVLVDWIKMKTILTDPREELIQQFLSTASSSTNSVLSLAKQLCYSPRQLSRKCIELTGMNAEDIILFKKYLGALQLLHGDTKSLTAIAYGSGFSDQSHFIRTFKYFTSSTPGEYRARMSSLPGHIYQNVR